METAKLLTADLLDILFDGRNKSYGAYELRRHYQQRMIKAMLITLGVFVAIAGGIWLKSIFTKTDKLSEFKISEPLTITEIKEIKEELPPLPPPPASKVEVPKIKTISFTTPIVTNETIVEPPPTQTDLINTKISNITQDGIANANIVVPPESLDGDRGLIASSRPKEDEDKTFIKVEIEASYDGDWRRFLERNLSGEVAVENGAAPGTYTVVISFIVDKQGNVSNIKPLSNKGFGMEEEAIRVIKRSGKWKPAIQNGKEVNAFRRQPITFRVVE